MILKQFSSQIVYSVSGWGATIAKVNVNHE